MTANTTTTSAIGQLTPYQGTTQLTAVAFLVKQLMALLDGVIPVQVVAVHPGSGTPPAIGTVDVQLLISQIDGAGNAIQQGIVTGLPYFRIQGGQWAFVCDPAVNDIGCILCADRDISNLKPAIAAGNSPMVTPGSYRKYNAADGIYLGGIFNAVPKGTIWCKTDGSLNITDAFGNVAQSSSSGWAFTGNIAVTGNITATGSIIGGNGGSDQVGLQTHTHPGNGQPPTPGT